MSVTLHRVSHWHVAGEVPAACSCGWIVPELRCPVCGSENRYSIDCRHPAAFESAAAAWKRHVIEAVRGTFVVQIVTRGES